MNRQILSGDNILLELKSESKDAAIERAGKLLVSRGYVKENYINGMKAREEEVTTYMGNGVAIPHGMNEYKKDIMDSGIVIAQYPEGVDFGEGNIAYIVIGIAGRGEEHMQILSQIALTVQYEENVERLRNAKNKEEIIKIIEEGDD
ncbi:PTS system mannitol-specific IIA component [Clostridium acetobutylicum]|uniref:Mannitol-specific phosphotransferase enzyme IIA component n=1 Tax=Clostridium acetobutylicum (strain ATCC 824 / DSM 792 / JCM 1419 / IAM 19013 / LMG 5710 / NBRC 13948 / NRRL B-527 / VKM B-1787 / 2291 / W) TaxID=272562 RepID=Q97MN7_CLOAB|nr:MULTISPECIES: PTS sugar transporter subunit IIA [Clostridium]AAK78140.1 PTS system, mannitol-specific IIA domain (Ntr-type) (gene MltF) [Clostridium acetobutylicum ATCC 824]ADZ19200.1 PTS system, mannitol-specific IIA domain (Ntr-type) (gene MltF) [Clostridium acetobutylicum EA 2018]AEI33636.1 PTS system mannitol-specific IIA domain-containing protein [Clostridium acetobutylicum DSM 1731]AWV81946.1 PTS mannitol transporter subunit IIA [Clostridium acetobutylicum]KHD34847.1 PTS mannitol tran